MATNIHNQRQVKTNRPTQTQTNNIKDSLKNNTDNQRHTWDSCRPLVVSIAGKPLAHQRQTIGYALGIAGASVEPT